MTTAPAPMTFKFQYVNRGQRTGLFRTKGTLDDRQLLLGKEPLPLTQVLETAVVDNRIVLGLAPGTALGRTMGKWLQDGNCLALEIAGLPAAELKRRIDRTGSRTAAEHHRQQLAAAGQEETFRTRTCPDCAAVIDLSGSARSPRTYCPFCENILDATENPVTHGSDYRICSECGLFGRVKGYTEFYFCFPILFVYYRYARRFLCDRCAGPLFWKMLAFNTLFLVGIPATISVKAKSLLGRHAGLAGLDRANALALKGRIPEADAAFRELLARLPDHPGLLFNQGVAHATGKNPEGAKQLFRRSLGACANYAPAQCALTALERPSGAATAAL